MTCDLRSVRTVLLACIGRPVAADFRRPKAVARCSRHVTMLGRAVVAGALLGVAHGAGAQSVTLSELIDTWRSGRYEQAALGLLDYRATPYGRNVQVDYMLATSFCRIDGSAAIGRDYFTHLLRVYDLPNTSRKQVIKEQRACTTTTTGGGAPLQVTFLTGARSSAGMGGGVRGKMFHGSAPKDAPLASDPVTVVEAIAPHVLRDRRVPRTTPGAQAVDQILALTDGSANNRRTGFASRRFVVIGVQGQDRDSLATIARHLEAATDFFMREFGMTTPEHWITVHVWPDRRDFKDAARRLHGLELASGAIGYSFQDDLSVSAFASGPQSGTLKHELFHLLVRRDFGDIPPWLDEGMAALYEVSRMEGSGPTAQLRGLRNWRERLFKRYWLHSGKVEDLIGMDWPEFDARDWGLERQAGNHSAARYLNLYLQEHNLLGDVFGALRDQDVSAPSRDVFEAAVGMPVEQLDEKFKRWVTQRPDVLPREKVRALQSRLLNLGFDPGAVDGLLGTRTRRAIKRFQESVRIPVTGSFDASTLAALQPSNK